MSGPEKIDAVKYIELLEAEIEELNQQIGRVGSGPNELLEYLKSLEPQNLKVRKVRSLRFVFLWKFCFILHFKIISSCPAAALMMSFLLSLILLLGI